MSIIGYEYSCDTQDNRTDKTNQMTMISRRKYISFFSEFTDGLTALTLKQCSLSFAVFRTVVLFVSSKLNASSSARSAHENLAQRGVQNGHHNSSFLLVEPQMG